jgi:hypothetical protein
MEKGQLAIYLLDQPDEIPTCEYTGEDVAIPPIFHDAIRAALGQEQESEAVQCEPDDEDGEDVDMDWLDEEEL